MKIEDLIYEIKNNHQVRFGDDEKENFRKYIKENLENMYDIKFSEIKEKDKVKNLYTEIKHCHVVLTAHYDTPRSMPKDLMMFSNYIKTSSKCVKVIMLLAVLILLFKQPLVLMLLSLITLIRYLISKKNKNNYNDNTSGIISLLYLIDKFKDSKIDIKNNNKKYSDKVGFIFFDYEERNLEGSKKFNEHHKDILKDKVFINLDCVGGIDNSIIISPRDKNYENNSEYKDIIDVLKYHLTNGNELRDKNIYILPKHSKSDYLKIESKISLGISNEKMYKCGYYIPNIHTDKDNKYNIDVNFIKNFTDKLHTAVYKYIDCKHQ